MVENQTQRRLTAILSADVKGYSKLMGEDDESTVNTITTYRKIIAELIQKHHGRVVDTPGDNILAEFGSTLNAVNSAIEIQRALESKNSTLTDNRRMVFRIGINLGDILHKDDLIYGDGVNVAARIESLADPGGICISRGVFDQVKQKVQNGFEYLGEHTVKNIPEPVRIYRILLAPEFEGKVIDEPVAKAMKINKISAIAITVLLICSAAMLWMFYPRAPEIEPASVENMTFPLPKNPSIAVLPFDNMSGDPEQEFFSDGLTEEIITALAKVPKLFVIARNSVFTYKGKPVKVNRVAEELGVKYVLEGSVRKAGGQVRITAQLIDALKGQHLWAERYDRNLKDIFTIYDEIALKIIIAMEVVLTKGEQSRLINKGTDSIEAYLKVLQGIEHFYRFNSVDNTAARKLFLEAISIDPNYPVPYAYEARTHWVDVWLRVTKSPSDAISQGFESVQKAIALDDALPIAHDALARFYLMRRQHQKALQESEKRIALQPNSADGLVLMGQILTFSGRPNEAITHHKMSIRLDPFAPSEYYHFLGMAYREAGQYDDAIEACQEAIKRQPNNMFAHLILAATYSMIDKMGEAHSEAAEVLRINPTFSVERLAKVRPHIDPQNTNRFVKALRKSGLE